MEGDTPLHSAVRYMNKLTKAEWPRAMQIVEILIEAGTDVKWVLVGILPAREAWLTWDRYRNKAKLRPVDLVDPRNKELRSTLQKAEYAQTAGNDIIDDSDDDKPTGSASDSE